MLLPSHKGTSHCCFIPKCLWSCSHDCPYSISLYVLSINFYSSNPDITLVQGLMGEFWLPRFFLNMIQHGFPPFPSYTLSLFLFLSFNSTSLKNSDSIIFLKARNQGLPRCSEECSPYPRGLGLYQPEVLHVLFLQGVTSLFQCLLCFRDFTRCFIHNYSTSYSQQACKVDVSQFC